MINNDRLAATSAALCGRSEVSDESSEYQGAVQDLEVAYKAGVKAFAEWFAREWLMTRDDWIKSYADPPPSDEWFKGQNAGVESVLGALDSFFGDFHP